MNHKPGDTYTVYTGEGVIVDTFTDPLVAWKRVCELGDGAYMVQEGLRDLVIHKPQYSANISGF